MENGAGGGLQSSNKGRTGLVLRYCFVSLENYRLIFCFFLSNLSLLKPGSCFNPGFTLAVSKMENLFTGR